MFLHAGGKGKRTTCMDWFSLSAVGAPGIELKFLGLTTNTFTHKVISPG